MADAVTAVYLNVVDDVIKNVRAEFQGEGVDESVLQELQALWELKLTQAGAIKAPQDDEDDTDSHVALTHAAGPSRHDLNKPYGGEQDAAPLATRNLLASAAVGSSQGTPYQSPGAVGEVDLEPTLGRPKMFMPKPEHWDIRPSPRDLDQAVNGKEASITKDFLSLDKSKRLKLSETGNGAVAQLDRAADVNISLRERTLGEAAPPQAESAPGPSGDGGVHLRLVGGAGRPVSWSAPQVDGGGAEDEPGDYDDDEEENVLPNEEDGEPEEEEDYNEPGEPAGLREEAPAIGPSGAPDEEDNEEELGSEDDEDDDEDLNDGHSDPKTENIVLATYEKVSRVKSKWKCILKDGMMKLNGRDILFGKANGEFEFDRVAAS